MTTGAAAVSHWFDFICPFCYVAQSRNAALREAGIAIDELPFEIHPEIPPGGIEVGPRQGEMYDRLEQEAAAAKLPLRWPPRLPNARLALNAAAWVRHHDGSRSKAFNERVFAAHFARGEDIGDRACIERCASEIEIDVAALRHALAGGEAERLLRQGEASGRQAGVQGTPAWLIGDQLVSGLRDIASLRSLAGLASAA